MTQKQIHITDIDNRITYSSQFCSYLDRELHTIRDITHAVLCNYPHMLNA